MTRERDRDRDRDRERISIIYTYIKCSYVSICIYREQPAVFKKTPKR